MVEIGQGIWRGALWLKLAKGSGEEHFPSVEIGQGIKISTLVEIGQGIWRGALWLILAKESRELKERSTLGEIDQGVCRGSFSIG